MKRLDEYGLLDGFAVRGRWFLPSDPSDIVAGELRFGTSGIRLRLDDCFQQIGGPSVLERMLKSEAFKTPLILGTASSGELLTLRRSFASHVGQHCEFVANDLVVGAHLMSGDEETIDSALVEFSHLNEWSYIPQFRIERSRDEGRLGISFPIEPLTVLDVRDCPPFSSLKVSVGIQQSFRRTRVRCDTRTQVHAGFAPSLLSLSRARRALDLFGSFLSLLVGEAVAAKKIRFFAKTQSGGVALDFFTPLRNRRSRIQYSHQMAFPLAEIAQEAPLLLKNWMSEESRLKAVYNLLLSTVYGPEQYVQGTYLSLTQALESFHRIVYGGHYEAKEMYQQVEATLLEAIPNGVSPALEKRIEAMLKYGNQLSLRARLRELLEKLGSDARDKLLDKQKPSDFVARVVDLRNYLTHRDETSSAGIAALSNDSMQMYNLNQRLRAFATALLLRHLGIGEDKILRLLTPQALNLAQ